MEQRAVWLSFVLHGAILALMCADLSFMRSYEKPPVAPIMIDLSKVQISNKTNLPQKSLPKKKKAPTVIESKKEPTVKPLPVQQKTKSQPKTVPAKPKTVEVPKDAVKVQDKNIPEKPNTSIPKPQQNNKKYDLNSLLASVEKVRQAPQTMIEDDSSKQSEGIYDGLEGRLDQMMTISDKDLISSKLRECWYIDGGAQDLEEIIVEVKTLINKDGSVRDVQIMNKMTFPAFESVADSARRAIHICAAKGEESPFYILAQKYADHYNDWREIRLRFSPIHGIY